MLLRLPNPLIACSGLNEWKIFSYFWCTIFENNWTLVLTQQFTIDSPGFQFIFTLDYVTQ